MIGCDHPTTSQEFWSIIPIQLEIARQSARGLFDIGSRLVESEGKPIELRRNFFGNRLISLRGAPAYLRSDSGPEFVSQAILKWLTENRIDTAVIDPGKPWQNGTNESFNGKLRDECLSVEWFRSREEARVVIETWRRHYNAVRPHSSLNYLTPHEFKQQHQPIPNRAILQE